MSAKNLKRLIVFIVSMALGFATSYLIITIGFDALPYVSSIETGQARSIMEYGPQYFFWTFFPIGLVFMIWLDAIFDTEILNE